MSGFIKIEISTPTAASVAAELESIPAHAEAAIRAVVLASALRIENIAKRSIQRGPKSGRLYRTSNKRKMHQASSPGQPPATDTGRLVNSIFHAVMSGGLMAEVFSDVHYAGYLELGTRKMAPRPYLKPALDQEAPQFLRDIALAVTGDL